MTKPGSDTETSTDDVDPKVSAQYRMSATEPAPDALNQAILRAARHEISRNSTALWRSDWFKPVAFVAMAVVSIGLILEMNDANILPAPLLPDKLAPSGENPANAFQDAADAVKRQIRDAEESASSASQNAGTEAPSLMDDRLNSDQAAFTPGDPDCDERQRNTVASWWQCIEALESRGASAAAERELAALMRTFPGFMKPDQNLQN